MRKKFLAVALAASLAFAMAPVVPVSTCTVAAEETDATETLTGTAWWDGKQQGKDYILKGEGTLDLYVGYTTEVAEGPAFSVELLSDGNKYITTGSDINIWTAEGATGEVAGGVLGGILTLGHKYKVSITRKGNDFTIVYFDVTDNKEHCTLTAKNTNMGDEVAVHVMAQVGTYMVSTSDFEMPSSTVPDTPAPTTPAEPATPSETTAGTNFANITTQPVVGYKFDSADGIELAGEAKVADGVLNLAAAKSFGTTYAKLPDLSSYDFSNGITLTADVKVTGYLSDWTPIFMLGDGKIGGGKEGCTCAYHFTQGFSSREDVNELGYFGNTIAAPYTWDWYSNTANQNRWDTLTVTIDEEKMTTYINGVEVATAETGFAPLLQALKSAKNNYLGGSYWADANANDGAGADADFQGSLDNVGIYNTALTAADVAKLTTAKGADITPPADNNTPGNDNNTPGNDNNTPGNNTSDNNDNTDDENQTPSKKKMSVSKVVAKKNTKKVTGKVSVSGAKVKVKVGSAAYKAAKVNGKKFTFTSTDKLKKGTKISIKVTKSGYKTVTKSVKVK